eukprot:GHVL01003470.1.p2 GENE.GHVL01003470.1~~GHVL01003470.1.p2  ORF type:complete len:171 (-),score=10.61 GHVL01003470.1:254-766(-)
MFESRTELLGRIIVGGPVPVRLCAHLVTDHLDCHLVQRKRLCSQSFPVASHDTRLAVRHDLRRGRETDGPDERRVGDVGLEPQQGDVVAVRMVLVEGVDEDLFHLEHHLPSVAADGVLLACKHRPVTGVPRLFGVESKAWVTRLVKTMCCSEDELTTENGSPTSKEITPH